jgi:vancomycin resistance protein YoaR
MRIAQAVASTGLVAGLAAMATLVLAGLGSRLIFSGQVLPGVQAAGIDLGGLSRQEVASALARTLTYPQTGTILLLDQGSHWIARPSDLGVAIDFSEMTEQALGAGRGGGFFRNFSEQLTAWDQGIQLAPLVAFDQRVAADYLRLLAAQVDRPTVEAGLSLNGLEVEARPGQVGRTLDALATLETLQVAFEQLHDAQLELVVDEQPPRVLDVSEQAALAGRILSQPLILTAEGSGPWVIEPATLAGMIRFELGSGGGYEIRLDPASLAGYLEPLGPELERDPQNARFVFNDDTRQLDLLQEAVIGRTLDLAASVQAIQQGTAASQHEIPLVFLLEPPAVGSEATAADLGISEAVSVVSTYFAGSSPERIRNIATASAAFHGLLIAPGETLSMADVLGDISLDKGYAEALIIYGDRTIKGVGGGVCQVSTTLFRTALYGGFEILERHPHAYRVGYYEQGRGSPGPGFDATVFVPLVDFKFTNDTPYWLLSETYVVGTQLLWKFYSTSDGRQVQVSGAQVSGVIEAPKPLYKENPDLPEGEIEQIDFEADGMDVVFTRTVTLDGQTLHHDTFKTHYLPWQAIFEYGPGTQLPEGVIVEEEA